MQQTTSEATERGSAFWAMEMKEVADEEPHSHRKRFGFAARRARRENQNRRPFALVAKVRQAI